MRRVVSVSGGVGSAVALLRTVEQHENVTAIFADTNGEDESTYDLVRALQARSGADFVWLDNDGRTIWDSFRANRFLGNTRVDICSRTLKREPILAYLTKHFDPADTVLVLGFDWTEEHRLHRSAARWAPWPVEAPLCDPPYIQKAEAIEHLRTRGYPIPVAYELGFQHSNCLATGCVKGGQAHWRRFMEQFPEAYAESERQEEELRQHLDKDVAILRDRRGGTTRPMTLAEFRQRKEYDRSDWGACSCMESEEE